MPFDINHLTLDQIGNLQIEDLGIMDLDSDSGPTGAENIVSPKVIAATKFNRTRAVELFIKEKAVQKFTRIQAAERV